MVHWVRSLTGLSLGWSQGIGRADILSGGSWENSFPCLFQHLVHPHFLARILSSYPQSHNVKQGFSQAADSLVLPSTFKEPVITLLPTPNNPGYSSYYKVSWLTTLIPSANIILLCQGLRHKGLRGRRRIILLPATVSINFSCLFLILFGDSVIKIILSDLGRILT